MVLSLLATVLEGNVLSLDQLPSSINNCRQLVLSGAFSLKDAFPVESADAFIRWKSLFTELRTVLIRLGLGNCFRNAFKSIELNATKGDNAKKEQVQSSFRASEKQFFQQFSLPVIKALYSHDYTSVAETLKESDVAIDYTFKIYNPEHHNPPQCQACVVVICSKKPPMIMSISDQLVFDLLQKWPKSIYKLWQFQDDEFKQVSQGLSDVLFPEPVREILLDPVIKRVFVSPDADLMCFPIDQLPVYDASDESTLPLFERVSVSILSSPRELLRESTVAKLRDSSNLSSNQGEKQDEEAIKKPDDTLSEDISKLELAESKGKCFILANPDYQHENNAGQNSTWKSWLGSFGSLLGSAGQSDRTSYPELKSSQKEAEEVERILCKNESFKVCSPITKKEATISAILDLKSPHILHLATHGYSSKQESVTHHGNFWSNESSGIVLAGAQTFLDKRFDRVDVKAGTGHMNCIAMCGMQLEGTRLVYVSTCDSSVGSRPSQEMPASITHAIRAAGAQTVISTLWTITDKEALEFVRYFYDHLMSHPGCYPSEALSYAKAAMRQQGHSMFYWGSYMCHGTDNPVAL